MLQQHPQQLQLPCIAGTALSCRARVRHLHRTSEEHPTLPCPALTCLGQASAL